MSHIFRKAIVVVVAILALEGGNREVGAAFNVNLLTNPGAESGALVGNIGGFDIYSTPGWTNVSGLFEAETYAAGAGTISSSSPGPVNRGSLLFYGGDAALTVATQTFSVSDVASTIDAGKALANISGWLGGFDGQDDNTTFSASYYGASNNLLGESTIGPVLAADRGDVSGLLFRSTSQFLPVGTRTIEATLVLTRAAGTFNNAAADNLNISLTAVPEPSSLIMCGIPLAFGLACLVRRRKVAL